MTVILFVKISYLTDRGGIVKQWNFQLPWSISCILKASLNNMIIFIPVTMITLEIVLFTKIKKDLLTRPFRSNNLIIQKVV